MVTIDERPLFFVFSIGPPLVQPILVSAGIRDCHDRNSGGYRKEQIFSSAYVS
jgi:hypothetical protein